MIIEYYRIREDVQPPERANPSDAGLDLKFNPRPQGFLPNPEVDQIKIEENRFGVNPELTATISKLGCRIFE